VSITLVVWLTLIFELWVRCGSISAQDLASFPESVRVYDGRGELLREQVGDDGMRAAWQDLDAMSPLVIQATLAVEDARFHDHDGIDRVAVARASWDALRSGRLVSGASTITMQLARLLQPSQKNLGGKIYEMVRARRLERALSKRAILEQYLNRAPYGAGSIGVEAASRRYFGKRSALLSLAEAALIAGLPKGPSRLNPLRYPQRAKERQRHVLARMLEVGMISRAEHDRAVAEALVYAGKPPRLTAMHFTDHVLAGLSPAARKGAVQTTLDRGLQQDVEAAVSDHVRSLALGNLGNAAVIVVDNRDCAVLAMVGSVDYWAEPDGAVNGALAPRQPGSTLKPFTYALAFEQGHSPASVVADIETRYGDADGALFAPQNFSKKFSGPVLMGDALGRSLNVPAIRVAERVGPEALLERLRQLGMSSLTRSAAHYGLGLTLGNGEVTLLELVQGYAALARRGVSCQARFLAEAPASPDTAEPRAVLSPEVSYLVTDILSDESLRIAAFGPGNALLLDFPVAVKTGTSSNWRDSWAIGYTERFTVGVWSGNFDGSSMNHLAGASGAGPLFNRVMTRVTETAMQRTHMHDPTARPTVATPPPGVVEVEVCALSGMLPSTHCPHRRAVHVHAEHAPTEACDWHQTVSLDVRNQMRAGELCPDQFTEERVFEILPPEYADWQAHSLMEPPPSEYSPLCPADGPVAGSVVITYPRAGETFLIEPGFDRATQTLRLTARADALVDRVEWRVDGRVVDRAGWPYTSRWPLSPGEHVVAVTAPGQRGHQVRFEVR
jgi:penicillin-binding protein 1C